MSWTVPLLAGFQVTIIGRFWVTPEGRSADEALPRPTVETCVDGNFAGFCNDRNANVVRVTTFDLALVLSCSVAALGDGFVGRCPSLRIGVICDSEAEAIEAVKAAVSERFS